MKGHTFLASVLFLALACASTPLDQDSLSITTPDPLSCSAHVFLEARSGYNWLFKGEENQIYDLTITNTGQRQIESMYLHLVPNGMLFPFHSFLITTHHSLISIARLYPVMWN
jgi:hypothetical protein